MPTATSEIHQALLAADRDRQGLDRAGRSRRGGRRRRRRAALQRLHQHYLTHPVKGGWYDQFDAQRPLAGRYHSSVVVLSYPLRDCGSRPGPGLGSSRRAERHVIEVTCVGWTASATSMPARRAPWPRCSFWPPSCRCGVRFWFWGRASFGLKASLVIVRAGVLLARGLLRNW